MNVQNITLDLSKAIMAGQIVRMGQGDNEGTTIHATILDNSAVPSLTGMSARFYMRMPDGVHYVRDTNCTISGNVITYVVDEEHCCAVAGYTDEAYFEVVSGSTEYSTSRFRVKVERAAHDGAVPTESWDTEIDQLIERGEQAVSDAEQAVDDAISAIDAANQAIARIEPTIEQAAEDAAEQATADAEQRIQDAIDAMGDISELAVPLMSPDVRGGAKLEEHGGLALRDGALGIGSLVQQSDGYARGGLAEVTAKGHAEQVSTSGKNLLKPDVATSTASGITATVDSDGWVTVTGTSTAAGRVTQLPINSASVLTLANGSTYTLSIEGTRENLVSVGLYTTSSGGYLGISEGKSSATVTQTTDVGINRIYMTFNAGMTVNARFRIQLELGSTATEYEPYTGAAPSPSPEFPQTIEVVRGRNLLDRTQVRAGAYTFSNGVYSSGNSGYVCSPVIECQPNTAYTINGNGDSWSSSSTASGFLFWDSEMTYISNIMGTNVVTPANARYLAFNFYKSGSSISPDDIENTQLELGSTPQPYVPYGHVGMEVQGKNLWSFGDVGYQDWFVNNQPIELYGGEQYVLSCTENISNVSVYLYPADGGSRYGASVTIVTAPTGRYAVVFTPASDVKAMSLHAPTGLQRKDWQLELGSTATEYEPYHHTTTPIPLPQRGWVAGLPDGTADSLRLDGAGKCEWTLPTKMKTYDGSENWQRENLSGDRGVNYYLTGQTEFVARQYGDMVFCSHSLGSSTASCVQGTMLIEPSGNVVSLTYGDALGDISAADFKAWLASNNVTVLAHASTPVTEDCGYVEDWPTDIPEGAVITISELDEVGIRYFVDSTVTELAKQWYARAYTELGDAITELSARVAVLEQ